MTTKALTMKSTVSGEHPVDRVFGRLRLRGPGEEEVKTPAGASVSLPARLGDLFRKVFGHARGASLELPRREPHEPIDLE
jgi:hypothetical protein